MAERYNEGDELVVALGSFIGREAELERWREMLKEIMSNKKGFFGSLLGGAPKQPEVETGIKSRVILIGGVAGIGKTRFSLKLRDITNREKLFKGKFRSTRLDWYDAAERDRRLAILPVQQTPDPELVLETLHTHFIRDDFELSFEAYQKAVTETETLAQTVQGEELKAVWEFRARALGEGINQAAKDDRPLILIIENFQKIAALDWLLKPMLEESGSQVTWVLVGANVEPSWKNLVHPDRYINFQLTPLAENELLDFLATEISRYSNIMMEDEKGNAIELPKPEYRSPDKIAHLMTASKGLPLAARMEAYLLQIGLTVDEIEIHNNPITGLLEEIIYESFEASHPDRFKIYSLGLLRRPEPGLMSAMLSLKADFLPINDLLRQMRSRYTFFFEPGNDFRLHSSIAPLLQEWLFALEQHDEESGVPKLVRRAQDYLAERLRDWGQTFTGFKARIVDVKWSDWLIDLAWFNFWQNEDDGWREALPALIGGMEYKPIVAAQVIASLNRLADLNALNKDSLVRLKILQGLSANDSNAWAEIEKMGKLYNWGDRRLPQYADELEKITKKHL